MSVNINTIADMIDVPASEFPTPTIEATIAGWDEAFVDFYELAFAEAASRIEGFETRALLAGYLSPELDAAKRYCSQVQSFKRARAV